MKANISTKKKRSLSNQIFVVCNTIFMILFVVITLYPVLNTLAISFNDFIKLNDNLLGIEDQQALDNAFNECISKQSYMFKPKKVNVNTPNSETHMDNEQFIKGTLFRR